MKARAVILIKLAYLTCRQTT